MWRSGMVVKQSSKVLLGWLRAMRIVAAVGTSRLTSKCRQDSQITRIGGQWLSSAINTSFSSFVR